MSRPIPQGIEVLVAKASLDPEFKALLLERRAAAAEAIGLDLSPTEAAMLAAVPADQLEAIIARTTVPHEHRRAFLGQAAAAMVAAVAAMFPAERAEGVPPTKGIAPDSPAPRGIRPDVPPEKPAKPTVEDRVIAVVARRFKVEPKEVTRDTRYVEDLKAEAEDLAKLKLDLEKEFKVKIAAKEFKGLLTVGKTAAFLEKALKPPENPPEPSRGIRPDVPPGERTTFGLRSTPPPSPPRKEE